MIPKKLRFKAFESYVEEQTIDFEKFSSGSVFLIHGETGAGKTAILDALTYALYGETSGGGRDEVRSLHDDAKTIPTEVEFIFELDGRKYKFYRSIKPSQKKSSENLIYSQNAFYYNGEDFIPFEANPTKKRVDEKAREILGLTLEQFRQIIILPQGQFEKFLTSGSAEKESVLSTIFNAEKYTKISEALYEKAKSRIEELKIEKQMIDYLYLQEDFNSIEELSAEEERLGEEISNFKKEQANLQNEKNIKTKELDSARNIFALFEEKEGNENKLNVILARSGEISAKEKLVARAAMAQMLSGHYENFCSSQNDLIQRGNSLKQISSEAENLNVLLKSADDKYNLLAGKEGEIRQTEEKIFSLKDKLPAYDKLFAAQKAFELAGTEYEKEKNELETAKNNKIKGDEWEKNNLGQRQKLYDVYVKNIPEFSEKKNRLLEISQKAQEIENLKNSLVKKKQEADLKQKEADALDRQIKEKQELFNKAFENYSAVIAASLKEGEPCPVCGSREHPNPCAAAKGFDGGFVSLKDELDKLNGRWMDLQKALSALNSSIEDLEARISELQKAMPDGGFNPLELKGAEDELANALKSKEEVEKLDKLFEEYQKRKNENQSRIESLEVSFAQKQHDYLAKKAEYEMLKASLLPDVPDKKTLERKIEELSAEVSAYKNALKAAEDELVILKQKYAAAEAKKAQAEKELEASKSNFEKINMNFNSELKEKGFLSVDEFSASLLAEAEISNIKNEIEAYKNQKYALETRIKELEAELSGSPKPDVAKIEAELAGLGESLDTLLQKIATNEEKKKRLGEKREEYKKRMEKYLLEINEALKQKEFAELFRGSKGISFTRYVLGVMLSMVTQEANNLLLNVHGGRFRLYHKKDETGKGKKTGLELEVQSAASVARYGVKNLSGGEKFLISLSLSMALSHVVQMQSGGVRLDSMFIDEGFGSLDKNSLSEAMGILSKIRNNKNFIGIISHVPELKEIIPYKIEVSKDSGGSSLKIII